MSILSFFQPSLNHEAEVRIPYLLPVKQYNSPDKSVHCHMPSRVSLVTGLTWTRRDAGGEVALSRVLQNLTAYTKRILSNCIQDKPTRHI